MERFLKAIRFSLLNSVVLCICFIILRGLHEGWDNVRPTNPPVPELIFFCILVGIQTLFGWTLLRSADTSVKARQREF